MDYILRRRELARMRYMEKKRKRNLEFLERILSEVPPPEIEQICYDLIGSGGYMDLDWQTRRMLSFTDPPEITKNTAE
jgi:hypothetical protein